MPLRRVKALSSAASGYEGITSTGEVQSIFSICYV
jgi:hypothetical protein